MEETFLYTVNPRKVITGISGVNSIRCAKSLYLTKEDVKICLKNASVYRRFAAAGVNERVNIGNIDRVHREEYISEQDWPEYQAKLMSEGHATVKVEEAAPVEDKVEEIIEEVVDEPVEEAAPVEEAPVEEVFEEAEVESDDEEVENGEF